MTAPITVAYIGNFRPEHSTETHIAAALCRLGHTVVPFQEDEIDWRVAGDAIAGHAIDLVLWTRTWVVPGNPQRFLLETMRNAGVPVVAYHLDRWWGLPREHQVADEPYFRSDLVVTADGGHDEQWAAAGVNHLWMPPAVEEGQTELVGQYRDEYASDVAFVGNWIGYHPEWGHRRELIGWLGNNFRGRFHPWCCGYRGQDLADIYASAKVIVGDSCLVGDATHYWSDRIPETLGRGGFLIHPHVEGLDGHYTPGEHLVTYPLGDWDTLRHLIEFYVAHPVERRRIALAGAAHVRERHTYTRRMEAVVDVAGSLKAASGRQGVVTVVRRGLSARFDLRPPTDTQPGDGVVVDEIWRDAVYPLTPAEIRGKTVVDIGANIGAFSIWAWKAGARKVWAWEPDQDTAQRLAQNVDLNDVPEDGSVVLVVEGVGGVTGERWLGGENANAHVVDAPESLTDDGTRVVSVRSLDEVLLRAGENLIVKMDCEGCEHEAIASVLPGHLRRIDKLVMEYHDGPFGDGWRARPTGFGELVRKLAEDGMVVTVGRPSSGLVNLTWTRYGA